ncbi:MAG: efflux RND transporter periplasmic adaptor subunit [Myxococcota bacterium]
MPHRHRIVLALCALAVLATGCDRGSEQAAAPVPTVVVVPVEQKDVEVASEWVGTTTGNVNAQIYPKIQGYLVKQSYLDGSPVKAGDLLFQIDDRQYRADYDQAKGQLARTQALLVKAQQDVRRYTPLAAEGAVSQMELDTAVQARAAGAADVESARATLENARLNLEWTQVKSPIDGVAGIANAQVGNLVSPQTLLTDVSQLDPIKVNIQISEIEYLRFAKRIAEASATEPRERAALALILADGSTYAEPGRFNVAGLDVAATTGTIELQALFPNPNNLLRPGQFAKVRAATDQIKGALLIPQRAVTDLQGTSQVAVVDAEDKVTIKRVTLGPISGSDYVVSQGLDPGDRVIVEGAQRVRNGMVVKVETTPAPEKSRN